MQCPVCKETDLVMSERSGVEIDYCPKCRGVWLDRGELDKIIERSTQSSRDSYKNEERYRDNGHRGEYKHKKRESFFSELFDF